MHAEYLQRFDEFGFDFVEQIGEMPLYQEQQEIKSVYVHSSVLTENEVNYRMQSQ